MKIYITYHQTDKGRELLEPVFFSKENAAKTIHELAEKRIREIKTRTADVNPQYVSDIHVDIYTRKELSETFGTLTLETEYLDCMTIDIIRKESFPVTCVYREDLEDCGFDAKKVTDDEMESLTDRLGDDYVRQMFWESLEQTAEDLGIPRIPGLQELLPQDGSEVDISGQDEAPGWTFRDDDGESFTDRATAVRLRDGKVEVRWEGERCSPACWEPLEWIANEDDCTGLENDLAGCVKKAMEKDNGQKR